MRIYLISDAPGLPSKSQARLRTEWCMPTRVAIEAKGGVVITAPKHGAAQGTGVSNLRQLNVVDFPTIHPVRAGVQSLTT